MKADGVGDAYWVTESRDSEQCTGSEGGELHLDKIESNQAKRIC